MNINSSLDLTSEGILDNFCSMMIEDYLKRKKMTITLDAFRNEWKRPEEVIGSIITSFLYTFIFLCYIFLNIEGKAYIVLV